jgi:cytochrome c nitrite reductase small subunit
MPKLGTLTLAGLALALVLGILVGLGSYTFVYAEGSSYLRNDPTACVNCHIMREQYDGWQHSSHHAAATCNDCHVPHDLLGKYLTKASQGYRHSKAFTLQDFHEPIRITPDDLNVVQNNCLRCHEDFVDPIRGAVHASATDCVHCHSHVGHGPRR